MPQLGPLKHESSAGPWTFDHCFDCSLAQSPTRILPVEQVIDPLGATHAADRIEQFRTHMRNGQRFPPVSVVRLRGRYFLADGHKRFAAYAAFPVDEVVVEVWTTRHWLLDQWRQFVRRAGRFGSLAMRSFVDREARRQGVRLFCESLEHGARIWDSLIRGSREFKR